MAENPSQLQGQEDVRARKRGSPDDLEGSAGAKPAREALLPLQEPRGIQKGIADADKKIRTGSTQETVRDTPPAGAWNDTSGD
jgi:hypothetical protein